MHQLDLPHMILSYEDSEKANPKGAVMQSRSATEDPIFHLCVKTISRSHGRSALACIAYRAGCEIVAEDGTTIADYRRRNGVLGSKILAPAGAPAWAMNRNELWLRATSIEKRKNSVEAREFEIAIPKGTTREDAFVLAEKFANEIVAKHGCVVDFSLHADSRKNWDGTQKNFDGFHVHFMLTTRRINANGFGEKTRELDMRSSGVITFWRQRWASIVNEYFASLEMALRIDARSNNERGIDREASRPLGHEIVAMERRGKRTKRGDDVRAIFSGRSVLASQSGLEGGPTVTPTSRSNKPFDVLGPIA